MDPNANSRRGLVGLDLRLLGRFELCRGGRPLHVSPVGERLLAYLAIRPEPVGRGAVAAELWPGCTDVRAAANLRSAVYRLTGHDQQGLIVSSPHRLALDSGMRVDIHDLARQLKLLRTELGLPPSPHFRRLIAPLLGRPLDGIAAP